MSISDSNKNIIYVNYFPYENTGKILNFINKKFNYVFEFILGHHVLNRSSKKNSLAIFKKGKLISKYYFPSVFIQKKLVYLLLPLRSIINFIEIIFVSIYLKVKYKKIHYFFSVNGYTAWIGLLLKKIGLVEKTIYWVWDYYPQNHPQLVVRFMRRLYSSFDKKGQLSDRVVYLSKRLAKMRSIKGGKIVPIGCDCYDNSDISPRHCVNLVFIGVIKKSQGLQLLFNSCELLKKKIPNFQINIIGDGPDLEYFRKKFKNVEEVKFLGFQNEKYIEKIMLKSHIGIAPYVYDESNVSFYGDPSKIKIYLSHGLPVVTTNVFEFSKIIKKQKAGIVLDIYDRNSFVNSIDLIVQKYPFYKRKAKLLAQKYNYKKIYSKIFTN